MRTLMRALIISFLVVFLPLAFVACEKEKTAGVGPDAEVEQGKSPKSLAAVSGDGPRIVIPEPEFSAGDVLRGEKAVHTFILKNAGKEVLHIKRAKGS